MTFTLDDIRALVVKWQPRLGLAHWRVAVTADTDLEDEGRVMEVRRHDTAHRATICVQPWVLSGEIPTDFDWMDDVVDGSFVERSVVHELGHLHFRDYAWYLVDALKDELPGSMRHAMSDALDRFEEQAVDLLARGLTAHWPKEEIA